MIEHEFIADKIDKIKLKIENKIEKSNYDDALELIAFVADVLYRTNLYYRDDDLEKNIEYISNKILKDSLVYHSDKNTVLVWDGFGLDTRGLMQIYLKALCQCQKVVYVTYMDRKKNIPGLLDILEQSKCEVCFIIRGRKTDEIRQLEKCVKKFQPGSFFLYSTPDDVTATTIMYAYRGKFRRYQINLTDHAFWLGAGCLDTCIEFREYGACISAEYRKIDKNKIVLLPYYPIYSRQQQFEGYPFPFDPSRQKLIFSGGSLYKTIGGENQYYEIVDYILNKYQETVFWYAGNGDSSEMKKIIRKYPGRAFLTAERKDLFQVMEHCFFYLNTFPLVGGLMMQYAVAAEKIPLTLRYNNDGSGILINQESLGIQFDDINDLKNEIDRFMTDSNYLCNKSNQIKGAVITEGMFDKAVSNLLQEHLTGFTINFRHENTIEFRKVYLNRISKKEFYGFFAKKSVVLFKAFPVKFCKGGIYKTRTNYKKLLGKILNRT